MVFFNQISKVLASLQGNKILSLDFPLYNFVLTSVYSSKCDQQLRTTTLYYTGPFRDTCHDCGIFFVGPAWNNCIGELSALSIQREVRDQRDGYACVYITYTLSRYPFQKVARGRVLFSLDFLSFRSHSSHRYADRFQPDRDKCRI